MPIFFFLLSVFNVFHFIIVYFLSCIVGVDYFLFLVFFCVFLNIGNVMKRISFKLCIFFVLASPLLFWNGELSLQPLSIAIFAPTDIKPFKKSVETIFPVLLNRPGLSGVLSLFWVSERLTDVDGHIYWTPCWQNRFVFLFMLLRSNVWWCAAKYLRLHTSKCKLFSITLAMKIQKSIPQIGRFWGYYTTIKLCQTYV